MILAELALKNVRTQLKSYLMYFISMAFSVMVYYSFTAMSLNDSLVKRVGDNQNIAGSLQAASVMIVLFILVFMFTANTFFLKKRKKEIGLYNLLGMRKFQIGLLLFMENGVIGVGSLVTGIFSGMIFSKLFSMLLIRAMYLEFESTFAFSYDAIKSTGVMFLVILFMVSLRSGRVVYRYKLVDLFKANQKGDRVKKITILTWLSGLAGVFLLVYGYYQASHMIDYTLYLNEKSQSDMGMFYGVMLILFYCVLGSYLFFHGFMQIVIAVMQKLKGYYYRDIHMVTTGGLRFHLKKNATTLGTIAVLSGTALAAIGGATNVYSFGMDLVDTISPMDFAVDSRAFSELEEIIADHPDFPIKEQVALNFKQVGGYYQRHAFGETSTHVQPLTVLSLSDYRRATKVNPLLAPITLKKANDVVLFERQLQGNSDIVADLSFGELILQGVTEPFEIQASRLDTLGGGGRVRYNLSMIVVADAVFQSLPSQGAYGMTMVNVENAESSQALSDDVAARLPDHGYQQEANFTFENGQIVGSIQPEEPYQENDERPVYRRSTVDSRYPALKENRINFGSLVYTAIFLGAVFLFATGSIIMLKQLSEAQEEKTRYQMLRKIGVSQKMIKASVYRQNFLIFFAPLVIAYLHSKYALVVLDFMIASGDTSLTWAARVFLLLIYTGFYFGTASSYYRTVSED